MSSMKKTKEGIDLKKRLRLKNTGSIFVIAGLLIIFVALSANAFIDDIQASLNSGMNDHISKPINMEELIDTITKYIKRD